jgi:hypothetical protein
MSTTNGMPTRLATRLDALKARSDRARLDALNAYRHAHTAIHHAEHVLMRSRIARARAAHLVRHARDVARREPGGSAPVVARATGDEDELPARPVGRVTDVDDRKARHRE